MTTISEDAGIRMAQIRREVCIKLGCKMESIGGCNAGCDENCACSVPVHVCSRCGDSDYGQNKEAEEIRKRCREENRTMRGGPHYDESEESHTP